MCCCTTMLSTDPSYDNRTIASTLKMQISIATNNRDVPRGMKIKFPATVMVFGVRATSWHLTSSKCTWMCWRVCWSPGAIRWPVADPGCGSRTQRRPTSPKRPRLSFRRSATTLYLSLTGPLLPRTEPAGLLRLVIRRELHNRTSHKTKASLIAAIHRVFAELPLVLVEKVCSQFRIRIEVVIEAEGGYIE